MGMRKGEIGIFTKIYNTKMKTLFVRISEVLSFFFFLNFSHEFFRLFILRGHDVTHTQIGQHNRSNIQDGVHESLHNRVVITRGDKEEFFFGDPTGLHL